MESTTTKSNVKEMDQMEQQSAGKYVPQTFRLQHEKIEAIDFHVFSDESIIGTAVALYAVIYQSSGTSQGLAAAKSRLSKKHLTIPRLWQCIW